MKSIAAKNRGEVIYEHTGLSVLVAISEQDNLTVRAFQKKHPKNKKSTEKISGFKLVVDQEFGSLKIDFSESFDFSFPESLSESFDFSSSASPSDSSSL